jgi:hypothetical protein
VVGREDGGTAVITVCAAEGCERLIVQPPTGRRRETCSDRCRKRRQRQGLSEAELAASEDRWNDEERQRWGERAEAIR